MATTNSLKHDGPNNDMKAIVDMVKYTITNKQANANRVYVMGASSGAMVTQVLLAAYPDVFKGGAEFAGVPAGCWAVNYADSNQWSSPCAGGQVLHTPMEWGDIARAMYPGYTGFRPRIQLWHGSADPTINYTNYTEAVEQWTNVLGLPTAPTTTGTLSIGGNNYNRRQWKDACGITVLDAFDQPNGPHGPSANMNGSTRMPFFNLDQATLTATDPQAAGCSTGTGGAGGSTGARRTRRNHRRWRTTGAAGRGGTTGSAAAPREAPGAAERPAAAAASDRRFGRHHRHRRRRQRRCRRQRNDRRGRHGDRHRHRRGRLQRRRRRHRNERRRLAPRGQAGTSTRPAWVETRGADRPAPPARRPGAGRMRL